MTSGRNVILESPEVTAVMRNFCQIEVTLSNSLFSLESVNVYKNNNLIESVESSPEGLMINLNGYGNYRIDINVFVDSTETRSYSAKFRFDGFGADPNRRGVVRIGVLGISRLALVLNDLVDTMPDVELMFVSENVNHIGQVFAGKTVFALHDENTKSVDEWLLVNGITPENERAIRLSGVEHGFVSIDNSGPFEKYLRRLTVGDLHQRAHFYHISRFYVGSDFIARYIRQRFGSVLPPSVDLSGARFAYGCISTVVNKNASVGSDVTIGQNVTIGGRGGADPVIENGVWIGAGAVILGCRIGEGAIIGANAVVTKDVAAGAIVVAAPIRTLNSKPA